MKTLQAACRRVPRFYWIATAALLAVGTWSAATGTLFAKAGGDGQIDYLPSRVLSARMFAAGALPLWNPYIFSGMSQIAIVQTAPFYPPNLVLYGLLSPAVAFNVAMALHVLLLLGFSHAFLRLLVDREDAAWLGAVTFSFCGFLMLHIEAIGLFNAAAWIPAAFYCVEKWIRSLRWRYCALGGVCLAMQVLAGWPQMLLLTAIYAAVYLLSAWREAPSRITLFAGLIVMGLFSAGLGAAVILPTMAFKPYSNLASLTYSHFISNSVAPQSFVLLLFPYLMGADFTTFHPVAYFGANQLVVTASYVGVLPLMLSVAAVCLWRASRYVRFAASCAVLASLLAFGGFTPLGRFLFHVPVYNFFRDHRVNLIFLAFCIAVLATCFAGNLAALPSQVRARLGQTIPVGFLLLAVVLLIKVRAILASLNRSITPLDGLWVNRLHQSMRFGNSDMLIAGTTLILAGLVFWWWARNPQSKAIGWAAVVFVAADLLWFGMTDQPHFSGSRPTAGETAAYETTLQSAEGTPFRTMSLMRERPFLSPNLNEMKGLEDIFGYSALYPADYTDLLPFKLFDKVRFRELIANRAILSLLNTRFIFAGPDDAAAVQQTGSLEPSPASSATANLLDSGGWVGLRPGQPLEPAEPFRCPAPPCGMQWRGLLLQKNSVYQLRFDVKAPSAATSDLDVRYFASDAVWPPVLAFAVSNVLLSPEALPYVSLYVTGDRDESVDLRFSTNASADLLLSGVSLTRAGGLTQSNDPYRELARRDGIVVLENRKALPRAFFVAKATPVRSYAEARNRLWDPVLPFDPANEALVEGLEDRPADITPGKVAKLVYWPNRATLYVTCPARCFMVLADLDLPGWQAKVDGRPVRIYRTDAVVRGIFVPEGSHSVEFVYRPRSVMLGLLSMFVTAAVVLVVLARSKQLPPPARYSRSGP